MPPFQPVSSAAPLLSIRSAPPGAPAPDLPAATARLVRLVRNGTASGRFPPVLAPGPENLLAPARELSGEADALPLARLLATDTFAPLRNAMERLADWCAATAPAHRAFVVPRALAAPEAGLFAPLIAEIFTACTAGPAAAAERFAAERTAQYEAFLNLFLDRLRRDLGSARWPANPALHGPVTALWTNGRRTHNGGQRVLRLTLAGGARIAYKPRPVGSEALFLARDDSLFALLNTLPAASGRIRLPVLGCWPGPAEDPGYSWQEWIEPTSRHGTLRHTGSQRLTGAVLPHTQAAEFWHGAGALTAASFGLGITELTGDNLLAGIRPSDGEPMLYPVDAEASFARPFRPHHAGLLPGPDDDGCHHPGLDGHPRRCDPRAPALHWRQRTDGTLELHRSTGPVARTSTRSVVGDTEGRAGYAPFLPALLRGMFDAWTLLGRHRDRIRAFIEDRAPTVYVRVIPRRTHVYCRALDDRLWHHVPAQPADGPFSADELAQLDRWDVPYFFRTAAGGPLLSLAPPPEPFRPVAAEIGAARRSMPRPVAAVLKGKNRALASLGIALRDAVEHAADQFTARDVQDIGRGVQLHLDGTDESRVCFDWPEVNRRITYRWDETTVRLHLADLTSRDARSAP